MKTSSLLYSGAFHMKAPTYPSGSFVICSSSPVSVS